MNIDGGTDLRPCHPLQKQVSSFVVQITQFLRRAEQTRPLGIATEWRDRRLTWGAFAERARRLAAGFAGLGLVPGDRIAILALNSDRYLEYFFGVAWGGFVFVPINTRLTPSEVAYWLVDSGCSALLVDENFSAMLPQVHGEGAALTHVIDLSENASLKDAIPYERLIEGSSTAPDAGRNGNDLCAIFYTGGTTGRSKGVMLSHGNLVFHALNIQNDMRFSERTKWLHAGPMFHLADSASTFAVTMNAGTHCFIPRFDAEDYLRTVEAHGVTDSVCLPTMLNMIMSHENFRKYDISSLHTVLYGGAPMPEALMRRALTLLPNIGFVQAYGQSEAAPCLTMLPREYHVTSGPLATKLTSAGRVLLGCEVKIFDEHDTEVPRGTAGEICARGPNVMLGYWNKPEETASALRGGWLHTGDGGFMDEDGFIYVVDRLKDMIISGGENVYSIEVEAALYKHPSVQECAVIGIPHEKWGEQIHAVVRTKPGHAASTDDLVRHCKTLIASFKCPRTVEFREQPLPLSGAGKILKAELRKPYWQGQVRNVS